MLGVFGSGSVGNCWFDLDFELSMKPNEIRDYLMPIVESMSNRELENYILSIVHITYKLSRRFPGLTKDSRRLIAMQYRTEEINRRKGTK